MEKEWHGFAGQILRINLADGKISREPLHSEEANLFLGGPGYGAKLLWDELNPGEDPLGPGNKMIISTGPLTGTLCPGSDSWIACFKSPLTGTWAESRSGGGFGPELKRAGFDHLIIEGTAEKPIYICIADGKAEIKSAEHLWGKLTPEVVDTIRYAERQPLAKVIVIGPAGENLVRFANVMTGHSGAAGRCGAGAVLGSKKVKAVMVRGTGGVSVADPSGFKALVTQIEQKQKELSITEGFKKGTASFYAWYDEIGEIPTKYGASNCWGKQNLLAELSGYMTAAAACESCTMGCRHSSAVPKGRWKTPPTHGPEYETMATFTNMILNDNVEALVRVNYLCNAYGMDTISCGNTIALAMECYERGWLTGADTGGVEPAWGNMEAVEDAIHKIARREGIGHIMGEGVKKFAEKVGRGAPALAIHVKGLDNPAHDPRSSRTGRLWLLQYGTATRGMCHIHPQEPSLLGSYYDKLGFTAQDWPGIDQPYREEGKAAIVKWAQDYGMTAEILGVCKFHQFAAPALQPDGYAALLTKVLGTETGGAELLRTGERVFNLQRCFSAREGFRREDDLVTGRFCQVPAFGPFSTSPETACTAYEQMLDEYYAIRGWDKESGVPSEAKLHELGLSAVAGRLAKYL